MYNGFKFLLLFAVFGILITTASAQVEINNLKPLLSTTDQKAFEKAESNLNKAYTLEDDAEKIKSSGTSDKEIAKNEKKYVLKRLEASEYYRKSNYENISILKDNITQFWKKKKGEPNLADVKNKEENAHELVRKARALRGVAEDLIYPEEKLEKIIEAEKDENEAIKIYVKVLYAYLNYPINYDLVNNNEDKQAEQLTTPPDTSKVTNENTLSTQIKYLPLSEVPPKKDTINIAKADTLLIATPSQIDSTHDLSKSNKIEQPKISSVKESESLYEMADVKEDQVDRFNKFLETSYPSDYENYIINFRELNYRDVNSLREAWHRYLYSSQPQSIAKNDNTPTLKDTTLLASNKNLKQEATQERKQELPKQNVKKTNNSNLKTNSNQESSDNKKETQKESNNFNPLQSEQEKLVLNDKVTKTSNPVKESSTLPSSHFETKVLTTISENNEPEATFELARGFVYRVQISACRIPVEEKSLRNIYDGNRQILELKEENWYKYAVGEFNNYNDARNFKDELKVPGAFVIAYLNGNRIQIRNTNSETLSEQTLDSETITYKVQVAACKAPLEKNYLKNIYTETSKIEEIQEDGWYKYVINMGSNLSSAKKFIADENIPGAFITSYLGDKKIELNKAIKTRKTKQ